MNFSNTYISLGKKFYQKIKPKSVSNPSIFLWNSSLAKKLMIPDYIQNNLIKLAQIFSGNVILPGSEPIATAYAGHQFGIFVPKLGDGRAHLLGEVIDICEKRQDIQLKGSGPTIFSRNGDGNCTLGAAVREFIMSETINALGVPTTRCLAVVITGEKVVRESVLPGAVVTRVASSHIRFGTFEFFAAQKDYKSLKKLCEYILKYYYPEAKGNFADKCIYLIEKTVEKQIKMVTEWMRIGFIHGVMNTDNMSIYGETLDYGPCAMMGTYNPDTFYSSIDLNGRYAFGNQPNILEWNINSFVKCLLPFVNNRFEKINYILSGFSSSFKKAYIKMMSIKIGITYKTKKDEQLILSLLNHMQSKNKDYTITFDLLTESLTSKDISLRLSKQLGKWFNNWQKRLGEEKLSLKEIKHMMRNNNPLVIPRNHHIEKIIKSCEHTKKPVLAENFLKVILNPYKETLNTKKYQDPPKDDDKFYKTFCGT